MSDAASSPQPIVCLLVGNGSLLVRCGDLLREAGMRIALVVTEDPSIERWASTCGLTTAPFAATPPERLAPGAVDYLFSIGNLRVLSPAWLALAGRLAINFHDGPLPAYRGSMHLVGTDQPGAKACGDVARRRAGGRRRRHRRGGVVRRRTRRDGADAERPVLRLRRREFHPVSSPRSAAARSAPGRPIDGARRGTSGVVAARLLPATLTGPGRSTNARRWFAASNW